MFTPEALNFVVLFVCLKPDGGKEKQTAALSLSSLSLRETEQHAGEREMDVQVRQPKVARINPAGVGHSDLSWPTLPGEGRGSGDKSALMVL